MNNKKGITLISLVITIIIMLVLVAIALNLALGNNGIINKSKEAKKQQEISTILDKIQNDKSQAFIANYDKEVSVNEVMKEMASDEGLSAEVLYAQYDGYVFKIYKDGNDVKIDYFGTDITEGSNNTDNTALYAITVSGTAGDTFTCSKDDKSYTGKLGDNGTYKFFVPTYGTYTIKNTTSEKIGTVTIKDPQSYAYDDKFEYDDWQTWGSMADVDVSSFATCGDMLANDTAVNALMTNDNAVDYLVNSTVTLMPTVVNNNKAVTALVNNRQALLKVFTTDDARTKLFANNDAVNILDSVSTTIPKMTNDTTPLGKVTYSASNEGHLNDYYAYTAFDKVTLGGGWFAPGTAWLQYEFPESNIPYKIGMDFMESWNYGSSYITASQDGVTWDTIKDVMNNASISTNQITYFTINTGKRYKYYRINVSNSCVVTEFEIKTIK